MEVSVILEKYHALGYTPKKYQHCTDKVRQLTAELIAQDAIGISQLAELLQITRQSVHLWCNEFNPEKKSEMVTAPATALERRRILKLVASGMLSKKGAMRQLGASRAELIRWLEDQNLHLSNSEHRAMGKKKDQSDDALQQEITRLKEALAQEKLKVESLETIIETAEKELKVNIRKKSGTR